MSINKQGKNGIEWCDYTWNPIQVRCRHHCEYCYMKPLYKRFPDIWKGEPVEHFEEKIYDDVFKLIKLRPSRIFVGSSTDLFGDWITDSIIQTILNVIKKQAELEKHKFLFLTKNPKRYSDFNFPDNCWLGETIDTEKRFGSYITDIKAKCVNKDDYFLKRVPHRNYFISCEPLLEEIRFRPAPADWLILGADSRKGAVIPKKEWFDELIKNAKFDGVPVFVKNNVPYPELQRYKEFPEGLI